MFPVRGCACPETVVSRQFGELCEQMALTGHKSVQVNVLHYQSADPGRMRQLVGSMSGFKGLRLIRESAQRCV